MARFFKRAADAADASAAPASKGRRLHELQPDPDRIGISGSVPFVQLPVPETLFANRAARLSALAPDHPMGGYLALLARIAEAQAAVQVRRASVSGTAPGEPDADRVLRAEHGMPLLSRHGLSAGDAFPACLDALLDTLDLGDAPEAAHAAVAALRTAAPEDRLDLAVQVFEGAFPVERMAACVFVAAALQVCLAEAAARLDRTTLKPVADGVCPCCGGAPVASLIVAWTPADKARYLACSLCGTLWNHVRIRCTSCGSGEGVSYHGLDEVSKNVQAETCTACHSYIKHLHQHRDPDLDPVADDVASYGLDLKVAEEGFRRAGLNPLFIT
ncbi:formate dehydrogenase accessory protein FdhE [uncultured Methylobacterium sp.]|uniref:formate dehydrogenase accessory protein FdhE n=1 Tax=uncultured Methylobacterium sp. TaxID=157278 RepID=UPI0035CAC745